MISWKDRNEFNIYLIDLIDKYSGDVKTAKDLEEISCELHTCIETVIMDMLATGIFESIALDDYDVQF